MKCNNCGAIIEEHALVCPYCGAENEYEAAAEQESEVSRFRQMAAREKGRKERTANMATMGVSKLIGIGVIAVLLVLLSVYVITAVQAKRGLPKQNEQLEKLESYYENGEYGEMYKYLEKIGYGHGYTFEKYNRVGWAYYRMENDVDWLSRTIDMVVSSEAARKEEKISCLANCYAAVFQELKGLYEYEEEGFVYEEEDGVLYIKNVYIDLLKEKAKLLDEEIEEATRNCGKEVKEEDFLELARTSYERLR